MSARENNTTTRSRKAGEGDRGAKRRDRVRGCLTAFALIVSATSAFAQNPELTTGATTPPPPAAPREAKVPQPVEKTLANGLRVIVISKHEVPLVAARLLIRTGSEADPQGRAGLASLTATMLTKGTKTRNAEQIARGVENLGAQLNAESGWDSSSVGLSVMSTNFEKAMEFVADVVRNPTFPKDELEREQQQAIDELSVSLREPRALAGFVVSKVLFAETPYGHSVEGTPSSLGKLTRDDLVKFHQAHYRPSNAILVLGGDVNADAAFALAEKQFGSWPKGNAPPSLQTSASAELPGPRVVVVDMPDAGQAAVIVARRGLRRTDAQYFAAQVTNSVLGGGYSSRLNQEVRIKRGLSYGAGSAFELRRDVGPFTASAQTKNESAAEVAGILIDEIHKLAATDVPESELTPRKAVLIGSFARSLETSSGIVDRVSTLALHGLPLSDINKYIGSVQAIGGEQVRTFAGKNLGTEGTSVVIVGDAKRFIEPLKTRFENVEVIPIAELDLSSSALRERKVKE